MMKLLDWDSIHLFPQNLSLRTRLSLLFTGLVGSILLLINVYIYYAKFLYSEYEFFARLRERAVLMGELVLERGGNPREIRPSLPRKFLLMLPEEYIQIYDERDRLIFSEPAMGALFSAKTINVVHKHGEYKRWQGQQQVLGLPYNTRQGKYVVMIKATDVSGLSKLDFLGRTLGASFLGGVILVFWAGQWYGKRAFRPMLNIVHEVNQISASHLDARLPEGRRRDEIHKLASTFNEMLSRLENAFETQSAFVNNASHELRTPLTTLMGQIEVTLRQERTPSEYQAALKTLLLEAQKLHKLADNLLILAKTGLETSYSANEVFRIDELLWEVLGEVKREFPQRIIQMPLDTLPDDAAWLEVRGNSQLLAVALKNLLENACKYCQEAQVEVLLSADAQHVYLTIKDNGIGIAPEELSKIFQPFYRASNARQVSGSGIGLFLVQKIVELHQGRIRLESVLKQGTTVYLVLPVHSSA